MLGHQLPRPLPPFESHWNTLGDVFRWLSGAQVSTDLPPAELGNRDPGWSPPVAIRSWRRGFPFELLRYAAANRLKVEIDYGPQRGRIGPRAVEPYSLRPTRGGHLVLFVVNDHGSLRSYRVDRIIGVRPTTKTFTARFRVEL
jgi:WYL domain